MCGRDEVECVRGFQEPVDSIMQKQIITFVLKRELFIHSIIFAKLSLCPKSISKTMKNVMGYKFALLLQEDHT